MSRTEMVTVDDLEFQTETDDAICVQDDGGEDVWLPKSLIEWDDFADRGDLISVEMPEWLAEREGLI